MTDETNAAPDHASLQSRIGDAEARLAVRRLAVRRQAVLLKAQARKRVVSPMTLVAVGALAFAAGRISRGRAAPRPAGDAARHVSVFAWALDAVALAGPLMALLRSARGAHAPDRP